MEYRKQDFIKSNGRKLVSSGPRVAQDRLKRLHDAESLNELLQVQIEELSTELLNKTKTKDTSTDNIDSVINLEIDKVIKELSYKHEKEIVLLKSLIEEKDKIIKQKDDIINILNMGNYNTNQKSDGLPEIATPFVDPDEGRKTYESHVSSKDEVVVSSDDLRKTVDKLKNLGIRR